MATYVLVHGAYQGSWTWKSVASRLRAAGHNVVVTSDGREGLSRYEKHRPDLVITDIFMPQRDGLDVVLQLAAKVRIIAISGGGEVDELDHLEDAVQFGAWSSLTKPFTVDALLLAVNEALAAHR